jgi:hypothetical protein
MALQVCKVLHHQAKLASSGMTEALATRLAEGRAGLLLELSFYQFKLAFSFKLWGTPQSKSNASVEKSFTMRGEH